MAWRASCGMIHKGVAMAVVLGGCRGEMATPSEAPKAATAPSQSAAEDREAVPNEASEETVVTSPRPSPPPESSSSPEPSPLPEPPGPPLAAADVVPHFQRWWKVWSSENLTNPRKATLDARVAARGTVEAEACDVLGEHVKKHAPVGSPELLFGDPAALLGRGDRCWWVHHDGRIGPGVGAALASDGTVLVVWVVLEG